MKNSVMYFIMGVIFVILTASSTPSFDKGEYDTKIVINKPSSYKSFKLLTYDKNSEKECKEFLKQYESYLKLGYQIADKSTTYPNYVLLVKY